jgi:hypothetical protein
MGLALHNYENSNRHYPASFKQDDTSRADINDWSVQAKLLPYVEQNGLGSEVMSAIQKAETAGVNTNNSYSDVQVDGKNICNYRMDTLICPSEINDRPRGTEYYPTNIGVNMGTGLILTAAGANASNGAFGVNFESQPRDFTDGLSNTVCMSEVKGYTVYVRDGKDLSAVPTTVAEVNGASSGSTKNTIASGKDPSGHTEWCDGRAHQSGVTTTFPPNTVFAVGDDGADGDYTSNREGGSRSGAPCVAVVTSRSFHPGVVNTCMMDGSTKSVSQSVAANVWQAAGTRNGKETVSINNQ